MTAQSFRALAIEDKAKLSFELGLISQGRLERVIQMAETDPSYTGILDLPCDSDIENELAARARVEHRDWSERLRSCLKRLVLR